MDTQKQVRVGKSAALCGQQDSLCCLFADSPAKIFTENIATDNRNWKLPNSFQICPQIQICQDFPSGSLFCLSRPHPTNHQGWSTPPISFLRKRSQDIGGTLLFFRVKENQPRDGTCISEKETRRPSGAWGTGRGSHPAPV